MGLFSSDKNLAAQLADLTASNAELLKRVEAAEATVGEKLEAMAAMEKVHADAIAQANLAVETAKAESVAKDAEVLAARAEVEEMKKKLANPPAAYADASEGKQNAVAEGGEAGESKSYWKQYYAIEDAGERTRFWRKNRENLENEQRHTAAK